MTLFFFFSFIRILDLEVEQNQAQEETLPSWLLCSSLAFSSGLLPSPLSLLTASLLSKAQRVSESMTTSWNHELCHGKEVGNESSWQSRACCWQKYPASGHRPRMSLRDVAKVRVAHPSLPSNEFVTRDGRRKWGWSGNEPWVRPRPAGQLAPPSHSEVPSHQACLTRAHPDIGRCCLPGWWGLWQLYLVCLANML